MSTQYCDTCGQYVETNSCGEVRDCGLANSEDASGDEDFGYMTDCPFSELLREEDDSDFLDDYPDYCVED